ncbi:MAG TPA: heavy metal translocating P-type ATPase [Bacteroidales bacterium]|jgi:Cu+-exporting ATPase|nr:heavy metal translocating P-type ATPase [Bacteroidales bacterium]
MTTEKFNITGMACSACAAHVEKSVSKLVGVQDLSVNLLTNSMSVKFDEKQLSSQDIIHAVQEAGYSAFLVQPEKTESSSTGIDYVAKEQQALKKRFIASLIFLLPLIYLSMGSMVGLPLPLSISIDKNPLLFALAQFLLTLPIFIINGKFFTNGFRALGKLAPTMDSLVAIGSSAAFIYGVYALIRIYLGLKQGDWELVSQFSHNLFFESGATILTLITLGKYLEARSKRRTSDALSKLIDSAPETATVIRFGEEVEIPAEEVVVGDMVSIRPGQKIPVDGEVTEGISAVDESAITGESIPVTKEPGDTVISASINKTGYLLFRATKVGADTTFSRIVKLLEEASASKAPIARLADRVSRVFVPTVILIALISTVVWLLLGQSFEFALSIGISVLIISCPCALGLATPVAIMVGTGRGAENGILFKSGEALEMGSKLDAVVFDKTGTVTKGEPRVTDIVPIRDLDENGLLKIAASLEAYSEHPISKAVLNRAEEKKLSLYPVSNFVAVPGKGVSGEIVEKQCKIGNQAYISENIDTAAIDTTALDELLFTVAQQGKTALLVADDKKVLGVIGVADVLKPTSRRAVDELKSMGIHTVMLTGDNRLTAHAIQKELGADQVIAEVLPQDKDMAIQELRQSGMKVAMVGDGINDAPALARADLGFAMSAGTDVAVESADVVLMKNDPHDVVTAIRLSKATLKNIKQNLFWAFFYNTIGIPLAAGVFYTILGWTLSPTFAAIAMSLSSITVVLNALRLKRVPL